MVGELPKAPHRKAMLGNERGILPWPPLPDHLANTPSNNTNPLIPFIPFIPLISLHRLHPLVHHHLHQPHPVHH